MSTNVCDAQSNTNRVSIEGVKNFMCLNKFNSSDSSKISLLKKMGNVADMRIILNGLFLYIPLIHSKQRLEIYLLLICICNYDGSDCQPLVEMLLCEYFFNEHNNIGLIPFVCSCSVPYFASIR